MGWGIWFFTVGILAIVRTETNTQATIDAVILGLGFLQLAVGSYMIGDSWHRK